MNRLAVVAVLTAAVSLTGCGGRSSTIPVTAPGTAPQASSAQRDTDEYARGLASGRLARVCGEAAPGEARCHAVVRTDTGEGRSPQSTESAALTVAGYGPADLQAAYETAAAAATAGAGRTVAVVEAYNDPNLEKDLAVYRAHFGLPACTTANGCLRKVNQNGGTTYPANNASWAQEASLDVQMVAANCPLCHILVVEASNANFSSLATAVKTAVRLGAVAVGNSYGGSESSTDVAYATAYDHPGVAITVSAGDGGYGTATPAAYASVIAVGGTSLQRNAATTRGWSESVWSGTGSGCSLYVAKPAWQHDTACARRTMNDVAYDADPNTGVAVYDSYAYQGQSGWLVFGGTSVGAPSIAAIAALAGRSIGDASYAYAHIADFHDIRHGSDGVCSPLLLCTAGAGYDGPTGVGTPKGIAGL